MNTVSEILNDIAEELTQYPEHWCQKFIALTKNDQPVPACHENAVCWCLAGHVLKRVKGNGMLERSVYNMLHNLTNLKNDEPTFTVWNDKKSRKVEDIIELCRDLANDIKQTEQSRAIHGTL